MEDRTLLWERQFNEWCKDKFMNNKNTSPTVSQEYVNHVLRFLQSDTFPESFDRQERANFKHKVLKVKLFSWCTVPTVGSLDQETVLTVPAKGNNGILVVVPVEKFFPTLKSIHENSGHARITTMWRKVTAQYAYLPKTAVTKFLEGCIACQCRASQVNEAEPQQIVATEVFSRLQVLQKKFDARAFILCNETSRTPLIKQEVDLIDMTMKASLGFRYILHLMDHFSKFHLCAPLKRKTAEEVNSTLTHMFGTIGLPHILQCDNGAEFARLGDIFRDWPGGSDVRIIHSRARHPQSQGLVERGHQLIQNRLAIQEAEWHATQQSPFPWHERLSVIQYQVNTAISSVTGSSPYEVVYGRKPKSPPLFGREGLVVEDGEADENDHSYSTAYDTEDLDQNYAEGEDFIPVETADETNTTNAQPVPDQSEDFVSVETADETDTTKEEPVPDQSEDFVSVETADETNTTNEEPVPDQSEDFVSVETADETDTTNAEPVPSQSEGSIPGETADETDMTRAEPVPSQFEDRHEAVRHAARANTAKANERRSRNTKKKGKRVDTISVGSYVTIGVPKEDRHKSDQRRLPGIVVDKRGDARASYKIRCEYGIIEGWHGADCIQLFKGPLPHLIVDGWERCEVLPLRTAAARQHGSDIHATRCGCSKGCGTRSCRCQKENNACTSSCHAGRPCSNRPTADVETDGDDSDDLALQSTPSPQTDGDDSDDLAQQLTPPPVPAEDNTQANHPFSRATMQVILPLIQSLMETSFSERNCENALNVLSGVMRPEVVKYMASELEQFMPGFPVMKPRVYRVDQLLRYGSGYMKFMPRQMRTSHALYNVSDDRNMCLYNSVSLVLYGDEYHSSFLKLGSVLTGIQQMDRIIQEIMQSVKTSDDVIAWAAGFASEAMIDLLTGPPDFMVSRIVERELLSSLSDNDSGPVQIIALSYFLGKVIEVNCCQENSEPQQQYGEGLETISLVRVPLRIESVDGQLRFNHFVPAIPRTNLEESAFVSRCAAGDIGVCNFTQDREGLAWVKCDDCDRWYHTLCLVDSTRGHTMKRLNSLKCGCLRNGPYIPNRLSILRDLKTTNRVLRDQRPFLKTMLIDVWNKKFPSWRCNFYGPNVTNNLSLSRLSGFTFPAENVTHRLRQFIEQQMPRPVDRSVIDYVLFPELLIRLFHIEWDINKVEAEFLIRNYAAGHRQLQ